MVQGATRHFEQIPNLPDELGNPLLICVSNNPQRAILVRPTDLEHRVKN